jgi:hypothetical protein
MQETSIYGLQGPSAWPEPPRQFSFSSLATIDTCPLQWQLIHGRYGNLQRFPVRPHPAAVEGNIVHQALDLLFKSLALAGRPEVGSGAFREEVAAVDVRATVARLVAEHEERLAAHPRGAGFRLRVGPQQLVNQVIRLFRSEYANATAEPRPFPEGRPSSAPKTLSGPQLLDLLRARGALSELHLQHPSFPFAGIIDLVRVDEHEVAIVDFKTGEPKPAHETQVLAYAVLWWRNSGQSPERAEVRYPGGAKMLPVEPGVLADAEQQLGQRIEAIASTLMNPPGRAQPGDHCRYCDVRQFCENYWAATPPELPTTKSNARRSIDIELTVDGTPGSNGFPARTPNGSPCPVVHASDGSKVHGPFVEGKALRILNARVAESGKALELMLWTEVFHR